VQPQQVARARALVEPVDVLRDQRDALSRAHPLRERVMRGVRLGIADDLPAPVVPFPHELRIGGESARAGERLGAEASPQSARAAKGRNAGRRRHARAGEHGDARGAVKAIGEWGEIDHAERSGAALNARARG
jgi:hypothetical protein